MLYEIKPLPSSFSCVYSHGPISHISMTKESPKTAKLESIHVIKPEKHLGTVLLLCAVLWAQNLGLEELTGSYAPLQNSIEAARFFYEKREIAIKDKILSGNINRIVKSCENSLAKNKVEYVLLPI